MDFATAPALVGPFIHPKSCFGDSSDYKKTHQRAMGNGNQKGKKSFALGDKFRRF